jgi:hypothetical protein
MKTRNSKNYSPHPLSSLTRTEGLMYPISLEEVEQVVFEMPKGKSPGPNGFTADFFQACWKIIKLDVWDLVEDSHYFSDVLLSLNATFLFLIPKGDKVEDPSKFRLISLCNVVYKIIMKVIVNHLKTLLPFLISQEQTGYVEGRQTLDGIILSHEVLHSLKSSRSLGMLTKLDMSKAYDKLSWKYIHHTLRAFGFSPFRIKWVRSLTSNAFFSILANGSPSATFSPSQGIRQGDPLFPFLFILIEGLGRVLKAVVINNKIKGLRLHGDDLPISHQ